MMNLTRNEQELLLILRELKPYERIEIVKDKEGRPDTYLVTRTEKKIFSKTLQAIK